MIRDARAVPDGDSIDADLCIVGGGAAGITLALELMNADMSIVLLEAGGTELDPDEQKMYAGPVVSDVLPDTYLQTSRLRQFGGTTNHWGGHSVVINEHVFGSRSGVPQGDWPFGADELRPYYADASRILSKKRIRPAWRPAIEAGLVPMERYPGGSDEDRRLGRAYHDTLKRASVQILLHGSVTRLHLDPGGTRVTSVQVQTLSGNRFTCSSRTFVLATGAIENARLLLMPTPSNNRGLGNESGQLGRNFGDHLFLHDRIIETSLFWGGERERFLTFDPALLEEQAVSEIGIMRLSPRKATLRGDGGAVTTVAGLMAPGHEARGGHVVYYIEPLLDADNRVLLSDEPDAFGQPRSELHFRVSSDLKAHIAKAANLLARLAGTHGLGRVSLSDDMQFRYGNHHMSTTRMSRSPRRGVVDENCRVHGMENLFVAGSSVFPSSGCGNPTYPLVALTVRLARHLRDGISRRAFN